MCYKALTIMLKRAAVQLRCGSPLHNCSLKQRGLPHMTTKYKNHSRKKTPWDHNNDLSPMESFIKSKYLDSYDYKHPSIKDTKEADLLNSYEVSCCKRCNSLDFKKKGFTKNGIQRYFLQYLQEVF